MKLDPMAVIYARFSPRPDDAVFRCQSIEFQLDKCHAYCKAMGLKIIGTFKDEEISGARMDNRPGLKAALETACEHKVCLVVYSISRLARSTQDASKILDRIANAGADLASVSEKIDTTSPAGKAVFRMMAVFAEFEREITSQRTSQSMIRMQANGQRMSRLPPYGYMIDPNDCHRLVVNPDEKLTIEVIKTLRIGGKCYLDICRDLKRKNLPARNGRDWHHQTIKKILEREGVLW